MCYEGTPDSISCDRAAERAFYLNEGGSVVRSAGPNVRYTNSTTYFRLMKKGMNYTGWYSSDGVNWILNGQGTLNRLPKMKYVGLFVIRQPWDGDTAVYSEAEFDYFKLTSLASAPASTPIPETTQSQDSILEIINDVTQTQGIIRLIIKWIAILIIIAIINAIYHFIHNIFKKVKRSGKIKEDMQTIKQINKLIIELENKELNKNKLKEKLIELSRKLS